MKKVIGITGGVGAGKSTILNILKDEFHAEIILTDKVAHELMQPEGICFQPIVDLLGTEVLAADGSFDKVKLGRRIFNDKAVAKAVNGIVHPAVKEAVKKHIDASAYSIIVVESALLIEAGFAPLCDEMWYVYTSTQERVKRLYEQRGYSEVKSYSIIQNQMSHSEFRRNCHRLIDNGFSREHTKVQVREFMAKLLADEE